MFSASINARCIDLLPVHRYITGLEDGLHRLSHFAADPVTLMTIRTDLKITKIIKVSLKESQKRTW